MWRTLFEEVLHRFLALVPGAGKAMRTKDLQLSTETIDATLVNTQRLAV